MSDSSELKWALPLNKVSFSLFFANLLASQPWLPKITQCISGTRSCQLSRRRKEGSAAHGCQMDTAKFDQILPSGNLAAAAEMMSDWWLNHAFLSECIRILATFLHFHLIRITLAILSALSSTSEGTEEGGRVPRLFDCCHPMWQKKSDHSEFRTNLY